ncbi:UNVERIFIED_CONTAM: hypothetical protein GTU68_049089 [Idotea baltica]|nr:hypothetical protein [Idotea baltica]
MQGSFRLWDTVQTLAPLGPEFVSVTYGAGGTTRTLTNEAVSAIHQTTDLRVAAHLTCVDATREETLNIAREYAAIGITDIVALRGPHPDGFASSIELIEALKGIEDFTLHVGAYPDTHPEACDADANIDWLKRKLDAGASTAITQFFFEADTFFRFRDACEKAGITAPLIPGILPIENWAGVKKFATRCGAKLPTWMEDAFQKARRDDREDLLATALATELCSDLIDGGVGHLHFYTLNKPDLTRDICHALGIMPEMRLENVA